MPFYFKVNSIALPSSPVRSVADMLDSHVRKKLLSCQSKDTHQFKHRSQISIFKLRHPLLSITGSRLLLSLCSSSSGSVKADPDEMLQIQMSLCTLPTFSFFNRFLLFLQISLCLSQSLTSLSVTHKLKVFSLKKHRS